VLRCWPIAALPVNEPGSGCATACDGIVNGSFNGSLVVAIVLFGDSPFDDSANSGNVSRAERH
jgi:hypothetical protein